jgi:hypothetical protein
VNGFSITVLVVFIFVPVLNALNVVGRGGMIGRKGYWPSFRGTSLQRAQSLRQEGRVVHSLDGEWEFGVKVGYSITIGEAEEMITSYKRLRVSIITNLGKIRSDLPLPPVGILGIGSTVNTYLWWSVGAGL